jgi:hypothetical protein
MSIRIKGLTIPGSAHEYVVERADPRPTYLYKFSVIGKGPFPADMLRYDGCYPANSDSASNIVFPGVQRTVDLVCEHPHKGWLPTFERWRSFGWVVKSDAWDA